MNHQSKPPARRLPPDIHEALKRATMVALEAKYRANIIKGNTALLPAPSSTISEVKQYLVQYEAAVADLLEREKDTFIMNVLRDMGYTSKDKVAVDVLSGTITPQ